MTVFVSMGNGQDVKEKLMNNKLYAVAISRERTTEMVAGLYKTKDEALDYIGEEGNVILEYEVLKETILYKWINSRWVDISEIKPEHVKMTFLGSGSAFVTHHENYHSNIFIEFNDGSSLLYDCGTTINDALYDAKIPVEDITDIFISHKHYDHCGGLEYIGFRTKFGGLPRPRLHLKKDVYEGLWENYLSGSMSGGGQFKFEDFFDIYIVDKYMCFPTYHPREIYPVKMKHTHDNVPAYGLYFKRPDPIEGKPSAPSILITGDCQFDYERMKGLYVHSDIIFHDCHIRPVLDKDSVHAQFDELKKLPTEFKNKMWLYHYKDLKFGDKTIARNEGFKGFVKRGEVFSL